MISRLPFFLLFVASTLAGAGYVTPTKSASDQREYRSLTLANGLNVMLISDTAADTAAASMDVLAGSLDEPLTLPGLAHYLEHCLFLGSAKYPSIDEFSGFLAQHHGSDNAFTAALHTNYQFDVAPHDLAAALDIWAQFFVAPLFAANSTGKEVGAVNAEHEKNLRNDPRRFYAISKDVADPASQYHHFATGDTETLQTTPNKQHIDVRAALIAFHEQFYVPSNMRLAVLGTDDLDTLEAIVNRTFAAINGSAPLPPHAAQLPPYTANYTLQRVMYAPVQDSRSLVVAWQLPPFHLNRTVEPLSFVSHLLSNAGVGSLQAWLRARGWALSVAAFSEEETDDWAVYMVSVDLTELGFEHVDEVTAALFEYIGVLRAEPNWVPLWNESRSLADIDFRFQDKQRPYDYVTAITGNMRDFAPQDVLRGPEVPSETNASVIHSAIAQVLDAFTSPAFNVFVVAPDYATLKPNRHEHWYDIDYAVEALNATLVKQWRALLTQTGNNTNFAIPQANPYVPTNVDVLSAPATQQLPVRNATASGYALWHSQESVYALPKSVYTVMLVEPASLATVDTDVASSLWIDLVLDQLVEQLFPAGVAGLSLSAQRGARGTYVQVSGYSDKLSLLLDTFLRAFMSPAPFGARFDQIRNATLRAIVNSANDWPVRLANGDASELLSVDRSRFNIVDRYRAVQRIDSEGRLRAVLAGAPALDPSQFTVQTYVHGNNDAASANAVHATVLAALNLTQPQSIEDGERIDGEARLLAGRVVRVDSGEHALLRGENEQGEPNGGIVVEVQLGELTRRMALLLQVLSPVIGEQAFNELRTKQQLGYIASGNFRISSNIGTLVVLVQSTVVAPDEVQRRIETFLFEHMPTVLQVTDAVWMDWLIAANAAVQAQPQSALERAAHWWGEISTRDYDFDGAKRDSNILKSLKKEEAAWLWNTYVLGAHRRRVTAQRWPEAALSQQQWNTTMLSAPVPSDATLVTEYSEFRRLHGIYPAPAPMAVRLANEDDTTELGNGGSQTSSTALSSTTSVAVSGSATSASGVSGTTSHGGDESSHATSAWASSTEIDISATTGSGDGDNGGSSTVVTALAIVTAVLLLIVGGLAAYLVILRRRVNHGAYYTLIKE
jgi:insulysin